VDREHLAALIKEHLAQSPETKTVRIPVSTSGRKHIEASRS
jgi:hypothetical protein